MSLPEETRHPTERLAYTGDLAQIQRAGTDLTRQAADIREAGAAVNRDWQRLGQHYRTPDSAHLLGATWPLRADADDVAVDLKQVGEALDGYVQEAQPLADQLPQLRQQVGDPLANVAGSNTLDWDVDASSVGTRAGREATGAAELENTLIMLEAGERRAADRISAVYGGRQVGPVGDRDPMRVFGGEQTRSREVGAGGEVAPEKGRRPGVEASVAGTVEESRGRPVPELGDDGRVHTMVALTVATGLATSLAATKERAAGKRGAGSNVSASATASSTVNQVVTVSEADAERIRQREMPMPTVYDPRSIPVGASVSLTEDRAKSLGAEGEVPLRQVPVQGGGEAEDSARETTTVKRKDDNIVTISVTKEGADTGSGNVGLGHELFPAHAGVTGADEDTTSKTEAVDIDLSTPEGRAAYLEFIRTGELPDEKPGVVSGKTVTHAQSSTGDVGVEAGVEMSGTSADVSKSLAGDNAGRAASREVAPDGTVKTTYKLNDVTTIEQQAPDGTGTNAVVLPDVSEQMAKQLELLQGRDPDSVNGGRDVVWQLTDQDLIGLRDQARAALDDTRFNDYPNVNAAMVAEQLAEADTPSEVLAAMRNMSRGSADGLLSLLKSYGHAVGYSHNAEASEQILPGRVG